MAVSTSTSPELFEIRAGPSTHLSLENLFVSRLASNSVPFCLLQRSPRFFWRHDHPCTSYDITLKRWPERRFDLPIEITNDVVSVGLQSIPISVSGRLNKQPR